MIPPVLISKLAEHFTVYTYDRRGRGESGDTKPYAVDREIEDIDAIIGAAGGNAYVFGVSSGAALSMQAAAKLGASKIAKLALYEPPYGQQQSDFDHQKKRINELVASGEPGDAASFFFSALGMPDEAIEGMKRSPNWDAIKSLDHTLAYDYEVLGNGQVPESTVKTIAVPTLVMDGDRSLPFMNATADHVASLLPKAERVTFKGQGHEVDAEVTVPALMKFFNSTEE
jgi:pimeloyl-ACP methyl ester carboxylesterase